ncbi:polyadenylate-binding protein-interacting protein 9-like [Zingiber officinale]|uniref:polyadenylate-binding protein-interacting protein 9-like n=1 Tax=Zingiber officinale TaxID=94328 RepID=UPI001C4D81FE|nr:polyadenylate-binding protein-interacting protein 9-like [Zingiber officinale]
MAGVAEQAIAAEDQFARCEKAAAVECQDEVEAKLSHLLSKLNPSAKEFFPSNYASVGCQKPDDRLSPGAPVFVAASAFHGYGPASSGGSSRDSSSDCSAYNQPNRRRRNGYDQRRWRTNDRSRRAEREDSISRIVYVSDIDYQYFCPEQDKSEWQKVNVDPELLSTLNCTFNIEDD